MSHEISVDHEQRVGNLTVSVTRRPESFNRNIQLTRVKNDGRRTTLVLFADELDDVLDALEDAADIVQGVADVHTNEQRLPTPPIARDAPRKMASAGAARGR